MSNPNNPPKKTTKEQLKKYIADLRDYADKLEQFCDDDFRWNTTTGVLKADETVPPGPPPPNPPIH